MWCFVAIIVLGFSCESLTYKAAVVDYHPQTDNTPINTIGKNLQNYGTYIREAKLQKADIIVFPEYGLTTMIQNPEDYAIKLDTGHWVLQNVTAMAKQNRIYVVVNLLEQVGDGSRAKYHNTNLVFDRNGDIVAKYRKINLFGEPQLTPGSATQRTTFQTDFGTTFGTFTCFDILYRNPSRTILEDGNIVDVVYPTSWFSTMPFYVSLSVQHAYAVSAGVNLLAANLNDPEDTHGGSGIYLMDGTSKLHISDSPRSTLVINTVPKRTIKKSKVVCRTTMPRRSPLVLPLTNYKTLKDFKASDYRFKNVHLNRKISNTDICYGDFCCRFDISIEERGIGDVYKVMAFDGVVPYDVSTAHIRVCSLLACGNYSNDSCGTRVPTSTRFSKLVVSATFNNDPTSFFNPLTLDYNLQPLSETNFCEAEDRNKISYRLQTTYHENKNVLVYGLFERTESK